MTRLATLVASFGGIGFLRPAPGSWGSGAAVALGVPILYWGGAGALLLAAALAYFIGSWAASVWLAQNDSDDDPQSIVIDEVAGQWLCLAAALPVWPWVLAAFLLFRLFDIWKPWPVRWVEQRLTGAPAIMLDDILAAGLAAAIILLARAYLGAL